jgi:hypothetical protein
MSHVRTWPHIASFAPSRNLVAIGVKRPLTSRPPAKREWKVERQSPNQSVADMFHSTSTRPPFSVTERFITGTTTITASIETANSADHKPHMAERFRLPIFSCPMWSTVSTG